MKKLLFSFVLLASAAAMYAQPYAVTFRVDMRGNVPPAGGKVTVSGDFAATATPPAANWTQGVLELTDANSDMVYEGTFQLAAGAIQYKFATTDAAGANANWEGQPNRTVTISAATVLPVHCFGVDGVGNCPVGVADTVNVRVKIDFTRAAAIFGAPHNGVVCIAGNFQKAAGFPNDWTPNSTILTENPVGSHIYESPILRLPEGTYAWKAIYGDDWGYDEAPAGACVAGGNRKLEVPGTRTGQGSASYTEGPYCFGSCSACDPLGAPRPVVFTVNVADEAPGLNYFVNGTFNFPAFQAASDVAMTDAGNGTFTKMFTTMYPGDYQYHYSQNDGTATTNENFSPAGCNYAITGPVGDTRRIVTIPAGTGTYYVDPIMKYNTCVITATETEKANAAYFKVAPNPFSGSARITFTNEANSTFAVTMTDVAGKTVRSMNGLTGNTVTIEQGTLITGVYFVTLTTANGARFTQKLVIQ